MSVSLRMVVDVEDDRIALACIHGGAAVAVFDRVFVCDVGKEVNLRDYFQTHVSGIKFDA